MSDKTVAWVVVSDWLENSIVIVALRAALPNTYPLKVTVVFGSTATQSDTKYAVPETVDVNNAADVPWTIAADVAVSILNVPL